MVSDLWLNAASSLAASTGISAVAWVTLLALVFCIATAVGVVIATKKKELGLPVFFLSLLVAIFIGAFDWLFLIPAAILIGAYVYQKERGVT